MINKRLLDSLLFFFEFLLILIDESTVITRVAAITWLIIPVLTARTVLACFNEYLGFLRFWAAYVVIKIFWVLWYWKLIYFFKTYLFGVQFHYLRFLYFWFKGLVFGVESWLTKFLEKKFVFWAAWWWLDVFSTLFLCVLFISIRFFIL